MRVSLITVLVLAAPVLAVAEGAPMKADKALRIGVVDMDRIAAESRLGKSYAARVQALQDEIDKLEKQKQSELGRLDAEIQAVQDDVEKKAALLSQDALEKKELEIKRKARERQAFLDDGSAELQRMRERAQRQATALNDELQKAVKPQMQALAQQQGIDVLLDARGAMAVSRDVDMSDAVIARLDALEGAARK